MFINFKISFNIYTFFFFSKTCYEELTQDESKEFPLITTQAPSSVIGTPTSTLASKTAPATTNLNKTNIKKKKKFQLYTRKLLQIALEILFQCNIPSMHYIALTTINRIYDIYVYHNLFNPGFYHSCYIPPSRRINSQSSSLPKNNIESPNQKKLIVPPVATTTTVSFSVNNNFVTTSKNFY